MIPRTRIREHNGREYHEMESNCVVCGNPFWWHQVWQKCCSATCKNKLNNDKQREKKQRSKDRYHDSFIVRLPKY